MNTPKLLAITAFALLLAACVQERNLTHSSSFVVVKTPQIKLAGQAMISADSLTARAQIYSAAHAVATLKADRKYVCIDDKCYQNASFNERALGLKSSAPIMLRLLNLQPLENVRKTPPRADNCDMRKYDIWQQISDDQITFNSPRAKILIKKLN